MPRLPLVLVSLSLAVAAHAQAPVAYPNPVGPALTVETDAPEAAFELVDLLGRRVDARSPLAPGVYLWRLLLPDGTPTDAQPITKLTAGPLDVRLVRPSEAARLGAPRADAAVEREGCRVAAPVFGGFQHEPRRGATLLAGAELAVTSTGAYAASVTCLGAVGGVGLGYSDKSSPWILGLQAEIALRASPVDAPGTDLTIPVSIKTVGGTYGDVRLDLDAGTPTLVEVVAVGPDGRDVVVASTTVPAGTPTTRRLARVSAPGGTDLELSEFTARTSRFTDQLLDSLFSTRLAFATDAPGGATVQINGATVQGDAVRLTVPLGQRIMFETLKQETDGTGYVVDDLAVMSLLDASTPALLAGPAEVPAWLRPVDPNGLMSTDATTLEVRCARGATCATYGLQANASLAQFAPQSAAPATPDVRFRGLATGPGRGLLFGTDARVDLAMAYALDTAAQAAGAATEGETVVSLRTPPASRSLVVDFQVLSGPPVTEAEVRYVRDGVVRRQAPLTAGEPVDLGLRVELSDVHVTTAPDGSVLIRATDTVRANSIIEIGMAIGPPTTALDYLTITMTNVARWSTSNVATTAGGDPETLQAAR